MTEKQVQSEIQFLDGPQNKLKDFAFVWQVMWEFVKGFRVLHYVGPCVTVFGSARFTEDHQYYKDARRLSAAIAKLGFTIMTGGGPGIMEAANRGAKDVGGRSVGCNIVLPHEQGYNAYMDKWVNIKYFFVRKNLLAKYSYAFVVMPGGFGTLDEYFEAITLIQTRVTEGFPVIIFNKEYHRHIMEHVNLMVDEGTISPQDPSLCLFTDSVEEVVDILKIHSIDKFGLEFSKKKKWWFFK